MYILILENDPERQEMFRQELADHIVHISDTAKNAILGLTVIEWDILFLDHDLGLDNTVDVHGQTGYEVACFLDQYPCYKPKTIVVHSLNIAGATKMVQLLEKDVSSKVIVGAGIPYDKKLLKEVVNGTFKKV